MTDSTDLSNERTRHQSPLDLDARGLPAYIIAAADLELLAMAHGGPASDAVLRRAADLFVRLDDDERTVVAKAWATAGMPRLTDCTTGQVVLFCILAELLGGGG